MKTQTQLHKGVLIAALAKEASKGIESPGQAEKCHGQQQLPGGLRTVNFFAGTNGAE